MQCSGLTPSTLLSWLSILQALSFSKWRAVASLLGDFFTTEASDPKVASHFNAMTSAMDLDMRFSEA